MILSPVEARIVAALELNADRSAAEVARLARTTAPIVYRTVERLKRRGVIAGMTAVIDLAQIGLIEFGLNLTLAPRDPSIKTRLIQTLQKNAHVSWIAEVGGEFDLMCNIVAESPHAAQRIIEVMLEKFSDCILRRQICSRSLRIRYPRWFLGLTRGAEPRFISGGALAAQKIDQTDREILSILSTMTFESFRDLARQVRIPLSTFLRRVHALRERNIVLGFGYRFDLSGLEALQFRTLLTVRTVNKEIRERLHAIAARERAIKMIVECLGSWDFELEIDQPKGDDVKRITSMLHHELHGSLTSVALIPIFRHLRYISFPAV